MWPFRKKARTTPSAVQPPVDLDKPVENPALSAAMQAHATDSSDESAATLLLELNQANYLVVVIDDKSDIHHKQKQGQSVIEKGSRMAILTVTDEKGRDLVPLFTDWQEIHNWTQRQVSTLVMPAEQAWQFVSSQSVYDGVVVNPAGNALELDRDQIAMLQSGQNAGSTSADPSDNQHVSIENPKLALLLDQVQSNASIRDDIYRLLADCNLVLGTREPLTEAAGAWTELQENTPVTFLTTTSPDGNPALPVFTDANALRARNDQAYPLGMSAKQVFEMVVEDGYEGIIVNPAANWIYIPRDDLPAISA